MERILSSIWIIKLIRPIILPREAGVKKKSFGFFLSAFTILLLHFLVAFRLKIHVGEASTCDSSNCKKNRMMLALWTVCILCNWYSFVFNGTSVRKLFKDFVIFCNCYRAVLKRSFVVLNVTIFLFIFVLVAYLAAIMTIFVADDDITREWYEYIKILDVGISTKRMFVFLYVASSKVLFMLFPGMVSLLHITLFTSLNRALALCDRQIKRLTAGKRVESFIRTYANIHKMAATIESAISLEILFATSYQFSMLYRAISNFFEAETAEDAIMIVETKIQYIHPILYIATILVAADIDARDMRLRKQIKNAAFNMSFLKENLIHSDLLSKFVDSTEAISFSAWGMFKFNRTFLVTSAGVLLTYSILIMQLPTSEV